MKTVAIVDDDIYIGNMLEEVLTKEGYAVMRAYSGTEALLLLSQNKPDLVLLDLMLPGLSGEEVQSTSDAIHLEEIFFTFYQMATVLIAAGISLIVGTQYSDGDFIVTMDNNGKTVFENTAKSLNPVLVGRLFDRFFTVDSCRNSTGLGLSIAKTLAERMGGSIEAAYSEEKLRITIEF